MFVPNNFSFFLGNFVVPLSSLLVRPSPKGGGLVPLGSVPVVFALWAFGFIFLAFHRGSSLLSRLAL